MSRAELSSVVSSTDTGYGTFYAVKQKDLIFLFSRQPLKRNTYWNSFSKYSRKQSAEWHGTGTRFGTMLKCRTKIFEPCRTPFRHCTQWDTDCFTASPFRLPFLKKKRKTARNRIRLGSDVEVSYKRAILLLENRKMRRNTDRNSFLKYLRKQTTLKPVPFDEEETRTAKTRAPLVDK